VVDFLFLFLFLFVVVVAVVVVSLNCNKQTTNLIIDFDLSNLRQPSYCCDVHKTRQNKLRREKKTSVRVLIVHFLDRRIFKKNKNNTGGMGWGGRVIGVRRNM
jgi:hypothetical protein